MSSGLFKNDNTSKPFVYKSYVSNTIMYKHYLALNNTQKLIACFVGLRFMANQPL